jgi:hypothetical protein
MNEHVFHNIELERALKTMFGVDAEIEAVIGRRFPVSRTAEATLFLTNKKQLFLFVSSQSKLVLGDVQKIVARVGLKAERYVPPKDRPHYFDEVGTRLFREVFPGRTNISAQDIAFYRTLAPYSPALILISEVKSGVVNQFDSDNTGGWRVLVKFAYRRIKTS